MYDPKAVFVTPTMWPLGLFRSGKASDATARKLQATAECQSVATDARQHDGWQQGEVYARLCKLQMRSDAVTCFAVQIMHVGLSI